MSPASVRRGRSILAATVAAALAMLVACAPANDDSARPLSESEAERLAVVRFRNFDAGVRAIEARIPGTEAGELTLDGWFDFTQHAGYAAAAAEKSLGLVWWNDATIATREAPVDAAPLPAPADGWVSGPLDRSSTVLTTVLTLIGSLGADRPENPQLLRQSDASWLRTDRIDGVEVDVFAGPSGDGATSPSGLTASSAGERTRYWVDAAGVLLRFEVRLGDAQDWTVVDLSTGDGTAVPVEVPGG